jgi:O-antigen ligase
VLVLLAVGSLIACLFFPAIGVHQGVNAGAWRGLWYEKNELGSIMVIGVFTCLSAAIVTRKLFLALAGLALCALLLLLSQSKTSLLCLFIPAAVMPLLWCVNRGPVTGLVAIYGGGLAVACAALFFTAQPDLAFAALGKDSSLTGRTEIWSAVNRLSAERPMLGYGYGAFWEKDSAPAVLIRHQLRWLVPSAHNAWMDVLIQLGRVGLWLSVALAAIVALATLIRGGGVRDGYWAALIVATFLVRSYSESIFLAFNNLEWVLFVTASTILLMPKERSRGSPLVAGVGG